MVVNDEKQFWDIEIEKDLNNEEFREYYDAEVAIIGAGGAGLTAAVRAYEAGAKKVLVLEKNNTPGGCAKMAMGVFAVESLAQKRLGINHTIDECFKRHMLISNWACNSRLVRNWMRSSGKVIDWLETHGVFFNEVGTCSGPIKTYHMSHHRTGFEIITKLLDTCKRYNILILTNTRVTKLIKTQDGTVCGLTATTRGNTIHINAKSVIIATGSIAANKDLIHRFFPNKKYDEVKIMAAMPFSTGDGFIMAEEIGAKPGRISPNYIGPHNHPRDVLIGCLIRRPHMMIVNKLGERYINEDLFSQDEFAWMSGRALEEQPSQICFPIMDETCFRHMISHKECVNEVEGNQSRHNTKTGFLMENIDPCSWLDEVEKRMPQEIEADMMKICNSIEDVAAWIGCSIETLKETVERYNRFCDNGHDDDFLKNPKYLFHVKTPPFYIFKGLHGIDNFIGGICINHRMEVIDDKFEPIDGLFAAGVCTSGWFGENYGHAGSEMGLTIFSGYVAGEGAASYIQRAK